MLPTEPATNKHQTDLRKTAARSAEGPLTAVSALFAARSPVERTNYFANPRLLALIVKELSSIPGVPAGARGITIKRNPISAGDSGGHTSEGKHAETQAHHRT